MKQALDPQLHRTALAAEVSRRRTFAIISHPDAGKTTLTEKLLLYAGAVELAGAVRTRKDQRHATSDWMAIERERGISVTSTALQFEYEGSCLNLLDTPGHRDFSEDTYRTLMAVDSAIMVLDSAKGIEPQTRKLFEVCRLRGIPILTFINKLDHPGRDPLDLLDEIERVLAITAVPRNWPVGTGPAFQGVYDLQGRKLLRFTRTAHNQHRAPVQVRSFDDPLLAELIGEEVHRRLRDEVELLTGAIAPFEVGPFLAGRMTPVFFGSALTSFGVEPFLRALLELAPPPGPRRTVAGTSVDPASEVFSGFVFKIQANMDPRHRDRVAFLRVCSGRFEKDMLVYHPRLGRKVRIARPHRLFAQERHTVDEAFPGDVIGLVNPGLFAIGDTVCSEGSFRFEPVPRFHPEHFATLRNRDVTKYKQFHKGIAQLEEEGAVQLLTWPDLSQRDPVLAAVGELQFEVAAERLRSEYGVEVSVERLPYGCARWVEADPEVLARAQWPVTEHLHLQDRDGRPVVLFSSEWQLRHCQEKNPGLRFVRLGVEGPGPSA